MSAFCDKRSDISASRKTLEIKSSHHNMAFRLERSDDVDVREPLPSDSKPRTAVLRLPTPGLEKLGKKKRKKKGNGRRHTLIQHVLTTARS